RTNSALTSQPQQRILLRCGIVVPPAYAAAPSRGVSSQNLAALRGGHFLFGGCPAWSFPTPFDEGAGEAAKPVFAMFEIAVLFHFPFVKIQRAADLDLQSMHARFRLAIEIGRAAAAFGAIPRHR